MFAPWKESYDKPRQHIKKQRHHFADKCPYSQSCSLSSSHVQMWELDLKESWVLKNWYFDLNCGAGEDSWESLGQQRDLTSQSYRKSVLNIHWKDWSWLSSPLATWYTEAMHWKRPWWLGKIEGKRRRGQQGLRWLYSITHSMNMSLSKLWEIVKDGKAYVVQSMGLQRVRHDLPSKEQQQGHMSDIEEEFH